MVRDTGGGTPPPLERGVKVIAAIVVLGAIMTVLDATIVSVAIDTLSKDFGSPLATIQWVMTGYVLALSAVTAHVLRTARAMAGSAPFYAFVSTTAVYQAWDTPEMDESAATWPGVADEDGDPADLQKLRVHKRGCELAVEQTFGLDAALIARAGSIVGPHDNLGQLPWWLTDRRRRPGDRAGRSLPWPAVDRRA